MLFKVKQRKQKSDEKLRKNRLCLNGSVAMRYSTQNSMQKT